MAISKKCCKIFLFIFNVIFMLAGISILGIGIWSVVDKVYISDIIGNDTFTAASYLLIISGLVIFGVCILGFISLSKESRILVIVYFIIWVIVFIILIVGAILAVIFRSELEDEMRSSMRDTLSKQYGGESVSDQMTTSSWDRVQHELRCCAVDAKDWQTYRFTHWFKNQDPRDEEISYVPASCCVVDVRTQTIVNQNQCQRWQYGPPRNPDYTLINTALYYEGCYEAAKNFVMDAASAVVAVGFAVGLTLIAGLFFTLLYLRSITSLDDEEVRRRQRSKTPNDGL